MDSWSVILNGSVEIFEKGKVPMTMHLGDCFGVNSKPEKVYHHGVMRTRVDDCQVCWSLDITRRDTQLTYRQKSFLFSCENICWV